MNTKRLTAVAATALALATAGATAETVWTVQSGATHVYFDRDALARLGLEVVGIGGQEAGNTIATARLKIAEQSSLTLTDVDGVLGEVLAGSIRHTSGVLIRSASGAQLLDDFTIRGGNRLSERALVSATMDAAAGGLDLGGLKIGFDRVARLLLVEGAQVTVSAELAAALGRPDLVDEPIAAISIRANLDWTGGDEPIAPSLEPQGTRATDCGSPGGPDVIVGDLLDVSNYASVGGVEAFAVGTTSCNVGDTNLLWVSSTNEHPVIAQNMYRLKNGRFEQVGQSWLKHGFTALTQNICGCGCNGEGGSVLGVGCSDPYCCGLNGSQGRLGPRFEVNPYTGEFPYPFTAQDQTGNSIYKRLQVQISDLDPAQDGGGQYFVEGHYVTIDDSAAGNQANNASYRPITVSGSGSDWSIALAGETQREQPAIRAWQDYDPSVVEVDVPVPGDGMFIAAVKTTALGGGWWRYEYAVQNLFSHRAMRSFSVPVGAGANVASIGFHDVDYHSGEPFDGTDWAGVASGGSVTWSTDSYALDPDANALRWGTLYNFRLDADTPPTTGQVVMGLFRPGTPATVNPVMTVPYSGPLDCNSNGVDDMTDIADGVSADCNNNGVPDECETFADEGIRTVLIASGLDAPVCLTAPPGDSTRLFICEQNTGRVRIIKDGSVLATPFLDVGSLASSGGERGLLSLAFHPDYDTNGYFYINYTNNAGDTVIARYSVSGGDPDLADAGSAVILKTIDQDYGNHNGGQLQFGPDGYLYVGMGDGGSGDDPLNRAQDPQSLLGKILRLDVDAGPPYVPVNNPFVGDPSTLDEIWALGMRNPWRFSFDRLTGDLYIGDVGQNTREEIDFQPAGSPGGENYGWDCREGFICTPTGSGGYGCNCSDPDLVDPILDVAHSDAGTCSITGGYVYRGCAMPYLSGTYFFADYCGGYIRSFQYQPGDPVPPAWEDRTAELGPISGSVVAFGEDAAGELYIVTLSGNVYKIVPDSGPECGNDIVETGEECDDGNITGGDGCSPTCQYEATCGNDLVEPGEQCDDGNTTSGDGCDSDCQYEIADACANAPLIAEGTFPFDTTTATTDGPAHAECSNAGDGGQTYNDIWFRYQATCSGEVLLDLCDLVDYDSDIVVYDSDDCGDLVLLGCNDDANGCSGYSSRLTFNAVGGQTYLVRVGGWNSGSSGTGDLVISNDGVPCEITSCGNAIVETGEQCDPPNGVTCDAACQAIECFDVIYADTFDTDLGWTVENVDVSNGAWERGVPAGDGNRGDPTDDYDGGGACYLTQNGAGDTDLDGGPTRLVSPAFDLAGQGPITLRYAYWLYRDDIDGDDSLKVEASTNGIDWTLLVQHDTSLEQWRTHAVTLNDWVTPSATTQVRFSIQDNPNTSVVEAGIDAVQFTVDCPDCNANGVFDSADIALGSASDCNSNGVPDACDLAGGTSSDCDGGPAGVPDDGATIFQNICFGCHNIDGSGGPTYPGPNIRNTPRTRLWEMLLDPENQHPGGLHPEFDAQDFADVEAYLSDTGGRGRPDGVPDDCQALVDCDGDGASDGCALEAGARVDLDFDGTPDACGPCLTTRGDGDADCDVDLADFARMQACYTGDVGVGLPVYGPGCRCLDADDDGDVDLDDFAAIHADYGSPNAFVGGCATP